MSGSKLDTYRERELYWRAEARQLPPGHEHDACMSLADGYARLVEILEREANSDQIAFLDIPSDAGHRIA